MSLLHKAQQWLHSYFGRYLPLLSYALTLFAIVAISFLKPAHSTFRYTFEKGQVWRYDDLYAPADFSVEKPLEQLVREQNEAKAAVPPVYVCRFRAYNDALETYRAELTTTLNATDAAHRLPAAAIRDSGFLYAVGKSLLQAVYARGMLANDKVEKERNHKILLMRDNFVTTELLNTLPTEDAAQSWCADTLARIPNPNTLAILNILNDAIEGNITYSDSLTKLFRQRAVDEVLPYSGAIKANELIITRGDVINDANYQKLLSFRNFTEQGRPALTNTRLVWVGLVGLIVLLMLSLLIFVRRSFWDTFISPRKYAFIILLPVLFVYAAFACNTVEGLSIYVVPFCIVPLLVRVFYTEQLAIWVHLVTVMLAATVTQVNHSYSFVFEQLSAGSVAVAWQMNTRSWGRFFLGLQLIFLAYLLPFVLMGLVREGSFVAINYTDVGWFGLNVFLTLLAYPLVPLVERVFGYFSDIKLLELADLEQPLLKELSVKAPGTLQHSLQVATLAEAAAQAIGANALLVRVGALYHDIGKILNPIYFIENQHGDSPHATMLPEESAKVIMAHVEQGADLARQYRLPAPLIAFIRSHHGTTRVEYFWRNYQDKHPNASDAAFRYAGPKPSTKEQTILMLADSTEAAARALRAPNEQDVNELVDKIFRQKMLFHQLDECNLSFHELETVRAVFKKMLKNIYHVRIKYPEGDGPLKEDK